MTTMTYQNIPIVMYHDISLVENPWCVTPENFTQHMQFLKENGYTTITLDELHNGIAANKQTEEKLIVITFDDARQGVWKHAFPLLRELGFTATVYIVPTWVDGKNVPPLENYSNFMTWGQLEQLHNAGWTIGSHSYSHQDLVKTSHLSGELEHADRRIKELLGVDVRHFSYPYGIFSAKVVEAVTKRYTTAVSIQKGFAKIPGTFSRQWILHATSLSHFRSLLKKPTLSLCMIVKNEQDCLARCLNSAKNVVDEIIIGDTGSTDTTKEIAMQFTKKVIDVPWQNDFSVARNEVLKHATSDWILILDADEILDTQASDVIEQAVHETQISGFNLLTKNYTNDTALQGYQPGDPAKRYTGWIPSLKVRLFRKARYMRW
jgi:peptidoglycan/xylan/chitin deacetylase (PgdA/CDA1 family)